VSRYGEVRIRKYVIYLRRFNRWQEFGILLKSVDFYGCETWSLTMGEEHRLRVFGNGVLRKTFGLKRDEVTGEWRKIRIQELYNLYCSPNTIRVIKSRRMRWAWHAARMEDRRGTYSVLVGRPEG
jgi:hypothetical protein